MTVASIALAALAFFPQSDLDRLVATVPDGHEPLWEYSLPSGGRGRQAYPFAFSPAGDRLATFATKKGRVYAFVDGELGEWGDVVVAPVFSADGAHVAYALGKTKRDRRAAWKVYVDGDSIAKEDWVGPLSLSDDGGMLAYWSRPKFRPDRSGFDDNAKGEVVVARRRSKSKFKAERSDGYSRANFNAAPVLDAEGDRALARTSVKGVDSVVAFGGRKDDVLWSQAYPFTEVVLAPGGKDVAFAHHDYQKDPEGEDWRRYTVLVGDRDAKLVEVDVEVDAMGLPRYSANGEHLAFVYHAEGRFGVGVGERLRAVGADPITRVEVADGGDHVAWVVRAGATLAPVYWLAPNGGLLAEGGGQSVAVAPLKGDDEPVLGPPVEFVGEIAFSPSGERAAYVADGYVRCGDQDVGPFDGIGRLRWVDDDTVAFGTREGREFWWRHLSMAGD